jgi:hypothetical protein
VKRIVGFVGAGVSRQPVTTGSKRVLSVGLILAAVLAPAASFARDHTIFARANAKPAEVAQDEATCKALVVSVHYLPPQTQSDQPTPGGIVGAAMIATLTPGYDAEARAKSLAVCMRRRGYAKLALTDAEAGALAAQKTPAARDAWFETFLAGDVAGRIRAALTPATPPLPVAQDADRPFVVGAARIDPATLALASGKVAQGGDILTGKVSRRRTAILKDNYRDSIAMSVLRAPAGSVFHEYLDRLPWDPSLSEDRTAWCGPLLPNGGLACIRGTIAGYEISTASGELWMAGRVDGQNAYTRPFLKPMTLVVQPEDGLGALDFHLAVKRLTGGDVTLAANAVKDGKSVEFWTGRLTFDAAGKARLPCWDRTLVLSQSGGAVTTAFEPRADGKGWLDAA